MELSRTASELAELRGRSWGTWGTWASFIASLANASASPIGLGWWVRSWTVAGALRQGGHFEFLMILLTAAIIVLEVIVVVEGM